MADREAIDQVRQMLDDIAEAAEMDSPRGGDNYDRDGLAPAGLTKLASIAGVDPTELRQVAVERIVGELLPSLREVMKQDFRLKDPLAALASAACTAYVDGFVHGAAVKQSELDSEPLGVAQDD